MKIDILKEIKKESSKIRVLFATTALGMGVNVPYVSRIIHIGPPSTLEAYMQEIGRAGRSGRKSSVVMYYNNSDIARNKDNIDDSIREYCTSATVCLCKILLNYFGFETVNQEECCVICNGSLVESTITHNIPGKVRVIPDECIELFYEEAKTIVETYRYDVGHSAGLINYGNANSGDVAERIVDGICFIESERDLLHNYNIWDEHCSKALFKLITKHAPKIDCTKKGMKNLCWSDKYWIYNLITWDIHSEGYANPYLHKFKKIDLK